MFKRIFNTLRYGVLRGKKKGSKCCTPDLAEDKGTSAHRPEWKMGGGGGGGGGGKTPIVGPN